MKNILTFGLLSILFFLCSCTSSKEKHAMNIQPPIAEKIDTLLREHGQNRVDPYFWMRLTDDQKDAASPDEQTKKVLDYLQAENDYTKQRLAHTKTFQQKLYDEIIGRIKKTDKTVPYRENGYWYYVRYEENNEYPIFCRRKDTPDAKEEILLNVNELAKGYEYYDVSGLTVSPDNTLLAFSEDTLSRRIYTIRFKNLKTGAFLEDRIVNTSGDGEWANDNKTFFYTSQNKVSLLSQKIYRHTLSTSTKKDVLVYHEKDPSFFIGVSKSKSNKYIVVSNNSTRVSDYYILDADKPTEKFRHFTARDKNAHEYFIEHFRDKFYIVTNWNAKNFRLMETMENNTDQSNWKEVIPHREDVLLEDIDVFNNHLVVEERKEGLTKLRIRNQSNGKEHYLQFDEPTYQAYTSVNEEFETNLLRFRYTSLTTPLSTFDYNMDTREKVLKKQQEVVGGHNPKEYVSERVWVVVRDGTRVPVSIVYKKGFKKDGTRPLLQYGYGSYGLTIDPDFSSVRLSLLDRGFAYAIAHVRGGEMMGRAWYEGGKMFNKKNTFYDFIDCSKYLIDHLYTSKEHLYASGGSAGGLLMGAIVNMDPDLYHGVVADVPFVDVVSTMLDESIPLTTNEFSEWGNPKDLASYNYMMSYSPYDNVAEQDYPNLLVTTGLFDSQVQYWEPAKWVAKLRSKKTDNNLLLLRTEMEAGHGGASGRFKRYKAVALEYAFLLDLENIEE